MPNIIKKDAVVIGAGPGGYAAAIRLGQLGKKVLLAEREQIGGTCLNWGCIPSKALIYFASLFDKIQKAKTFGIEAGNLSANLSVFQQWKNQTVAKLTNGIATLCKGVQVEIISGRARFKSTRQLEINQTDETLIVEAEHFIIATGATPVLLPNFPLVKGKVMTSKEVLDLTSIPKSFLVIGGGVIGLELGMALQKLGSKLMVVELMEQLLSGTDPELVRPVERSIKKRGGEIYLKTKVTGSAAAQNEYAIELETPNGKQTVSAEAILISVGVKPVTENLNLQALGLKLNPKGFIQVNEQARTNIQNIFAIGDVNGPPFLAHKAFKEAEVAAEIMAGKHRRLDYRAMPAAIFTDPEIATVGLSEGEAKAAGRDVAVGRYPVAASGRALTMGESDGVIKVVIDRSSREILGVGLACPEASELIGEGALAIEMGALAEDFAATIHPHPTLSEGLMEAFKQTQGEAIHIPNSPSQPSAAQEIGVKK